MADRVHIALRLLNL